MSTPPPSAVESIREIESRYDAAEPETFWACEAALGRLLAGHFVQDWINHQLRELLTDATFDGDWAARDITLYRGATWSLSLAIVDRPRRYIHALPVLGIYAPLNNELTVERFRLPDAFRNDVFDPAIRLEPHDQLVARSAETVRIDTNRFAYYLHAAEPVPILRMETFPTRPLEWLFSRLTLQAWQANDATLSYTQLRVAAHVLGKIAHQSSIAPLRDLAKHPHHAVRWAAIQNLGRLNRSEALTKIREAVNDPHPHVRRAARKTLEKLEGRPT